MGHLIHPSFTAYDFISAHAGLIVDREAKSGFGAMALGKAAFCDYSRSQATPPQA
jgi:hypothetical protein